MRLFLLRILPVSLIFGSGFLLAGSASATEQVIAIIIDDIGWRKQDDLHALDLPGALTYSILPQTPNSKFMDEKIHEKGREVMLHLPMESIKDNNLLGPGALTSKMSQEEFMSTLDDDFNSVPNAVGVNNHMGSLLTRDELAMHRLMNALQRPNAPFFINSRTTDTTLPGDVAKLYGIANTSRDVFLDDELDSQSIINEFRKLVSIAKAKGSALAIAHPHPETIETLDYLLSNLKDYGVKLVTITEFMKIRDRGNYLWHTSSSPSLTAVRN